jgi:putative copper export protein
MLATFHFVHMIAGVVYGGGVMLFAWGILPTLHRMEPEARATSFNTLQRYASPLMATAGILVLLGGIARAWVSGQIAGFGDLFSGYGLMVTLALVVFVVWQGWDGMTRARISRAIEAKDTETLGRIVGPFRWVNSIALLIILGLMGAMRLGLY